MFDNYIIIELVFFLKKPMLTYFVHLKTLL